MEAVFKICNEAGLHSRPASKIINVCKKYNSDVILTCGEKTASVKSIISILKLGAVKNSEVKVTVIGEDEKMVVEELRELFMLNFGE